MKSIWLSLFILAMSSLRAQHCVSGRYSETPLFDSTEIVVLENIEYGNATHYFTGQNVPLVMDVYYPDPAIDPLSSRPFILNIHGGGFIGGDKNELAYESLEFARRGFVVANINYRVGWNCDNVICFNCYGTNMQKAIYCAVQDARAAMRFCYDNKEEWAIDENWAFSCGESAGSITSMLSTFWDQEEAEAQVQAGFAAEVGTLNASGNALSGTFSIKAVIDQCGAIPNLADMDDNGNIPMIGFHDSNDCVVPYQGGPLIACFCSGFLYYYGSAAIHSHMLTNGGCSELHTAPQPILPNHCTYPKPFIVQLSSCFLKRVMCGYCMSFQDDDIYATPICGTVSNSISLISGCTYPNALNFLPTATLDDGSCIFGPDCPADIDLNGFVGVSDLLEFMGAFGTTCD